mmetsp:Transcript_20120/g.36152  ORF Transcript_20120/g.36152 Transcript_20120/m.36152 type:complete len:149 (-) Transcript_20120:69-515(-)
MVFAYENTSDKEFVQEVKKFEDFKRNELDPELIRLTEIKNKLINDLEEWTKLETDIKKNIKNQPKSLEVYADLGEQVFSKAVVNDVNKINLNIGMGFFVECSLEESLNIIEIRKSSLSDQMKKHDNKLLETKDHLAKVSKAFLELSQA